MVLKPVFWHPVNTQYMLVTIMTTVITIISFFATFQFYTCHSGLTPELETYISSCLLNNPIQYVTDMEN